MEILKTTRAGHAKDHVSSFDFSTFDGKILLYVW